MEKIFLKGQFECFFCESLVGGDKIYYDTQRQICFCPECFTAVYGNKNVIIMGDEDRFDESMEDKRNG